MSRIEGYRTIKMFGNPANGKKTIREIRHKIEDMVSVEESETFPALEFGIRVP